MKTRGYDLDLTA